MSWYMKEQWQTELVLHLVLNLNSVIVPNLKIVFQKVCFQNGDRGCWSPKMHHK